MGGSFDPVHIGHLRVALEAIETLGLEGVRWIPSGAPGHRGAPEATASDRLAMLGLACQDEPRFQIDPAELDLDEPTFTINSLKRLRSELGAQHALVMLIGMDNLLKLHTWRDWQSLFEYAHFAVAQRPGYELKIEALDPNLRSVYQDRVGDLSALSAPSGHILHFESLALPISSSDIRARLKRGGSIRYLVPEPVRRFIEARQLYR